MHHDSATLITFVLDESGSMSHLAQAARDGFNEFLEEQTATGLTWWTLTTFANRSRTRFAVIPGAEVRPIGDEYSPHGMTALLDAVGGAVNKTNAFLRTLGANRPENVVVVILTDGMENASRRWTRRQVADLITEAEQDGWQFVFLGANQDSWAVAQEIGIRRGAVVDWAPDPASHERAMMEAAEASMDYRRTRQQQARYRDRRER